MVSLAFSRTPPSLRPTDTTVFNYLRSPRGMERLRKLVETHEKANEHTETVPEGKRLHHSGDEIRYMAPRVFERVDAFLGTRPPLVYPVVLTPDDFQSSPVLKRFLVGFHPTDMMRYGVLTAAGATAALMGHPEISPLFGWLVLRYLDSKNEIAMRSLQRVVRGDATAEIYSGNFIYHSTIMIPNSLMPAELELILAHEYVHYLQPNRKSKGGEYNITIEGEAEAIGGSIVAAQTDLDPASSGVVYLNRLHQGRVKNTYNFLAQKALAAALLWVRSDLFQNLKTASSHFGSALPYVFGAAWYQILEEEFGPAIYAKVLRGDYSDVWELLAEAA